jgi:hypothetical protein
MVSTPLIDRINSLGNIDLWENLHDHHSRTGSCRNVVNREKIDSSPEPVDFWAIHVQDANSTEERSLILTSM